MSEYTQDEIKNILIQHANYLKTGEGIRTDLSSVNLRNADLRNADLSYANLRNADLRNANLSYANLRNADLSGANLKNADLRNADLSGANLRNADLRNADLRNADLSGADLRNTDLRNADLSGANLRNTNLPAPTLVLLANWGKLSNETTLALMRLDASAHPDSTLFDIWKEYGECPYSNSNIERVANFKENHKIWSQGPAPTIWEAMSMVLTESCKNWN